MYVYVYVDIYVDVFHYVCSDVYVLFMFICVVSVFEFGCLLYCFVDVQFVFHVYVHAHAYVYV